MLLPHMLRHVLQVHVRKKLFFHDPLLQKLQHVLSAVSHG